MKKCSEYISIIKDFFFGRRERLEAIDYTVANIAYNEERERRLARFDALRAQDEAEKLRYAKLEAEKQKEKDKLMKIIEDGFFEPDANYDENAIGDLCEIMENPNKYLIKECILPCQLLWSKNVYPVSTSGYNDSETWIAINIEDLAEYNMDVITNLPKENKRLEGEKVIISVEGHGPAALEKMLQVVGMFKLQDVPTNRGYFVIKDSLIYDAVDFGENSELTIDSDSGLVFKSKAFYDGHQRYLRACEVFEKDFGLAKVVAK